MVAVDGSSMGDYAPADDPLSADERSAENDNDDDDEDSEDSDDNDYDDDGQTTVYTSDDDDGVPSSLLTDPRSPPMLPYPGPWVCHTSNAFPAWFHSAFVLLETEKAKDKSVNAVADLQDTVRQQEHELTRAAMDIGKRPCCSDHLHLLKDTDADTS